MLSRYPEKALCTERTSAFQHGPDEIAGDAHHLVPALPVRQGQMPAVTADRAQHMGLGPAGRRADPLHGIAARAAAVMPELDITDRDIAGGQQGPQPGLLMGYLGHMAPADHPLVSLPGRGLPRGLAARGTDLHRLSPGFPGQPPAQGPFAQTAGAGRPVERRGEDQQAAGRGQPGLPGPEKRIQSSRPPRE